jgi:putative ABC transport system permease protein
MCMHTLVQDIRYGIRQLRHAPGFTVLAAGVLALGIGVISAMFSVVDAVLLRPLPFNEPSKLVMLWEKAPGYDHNRVSPLNFLDWHDLNGVFSSVAAVAGGDRTLQSKYGPEQLTGQSVTSEFFHLLEVRPIVGREFSTEDDRARTDVVMIGERLWRTRFGSDPKVVGSPLTLNGKPALVIGVVPERFEILWKSELWTLFTVKRSPEQRRMHYMQVLGKLKPGVSIEQAQAAMTLVADDIARISPDTNKGWGITIEPLRAALVGHELRVTTLVVAAVVGFVLLMVCANVANLTLARSSRRTREMAVRAALGAAKPRLVRQLLTESVLLSSIGGLGGLMLAWAIIRLVPSIIPPGTLPVGLPLTLDARVTTFAVVVTLLTGLIFGLAPAWQVSRSSLAGALQSSGRSASSGNTSLLSAIATVQIAVGVMIVAGTVLLVRTLERLSQVDPGFHADRVLTMHMALPLSRYPTPDKALIFYRNVERDLTTLPGVRAAAFGGSLPLQGWDIGQGFEIVGEPRRSESESPAAHYQIVGPRYFETLGISLESGRVFDEQDTAEGPEVAIVNDEFVRQYLHGRRAVGTHLRVQAMDPNGPRPVEREIVGVIEQVKVEGLGEKQNAAEIYVPIMQNPWYWASLAVRTSGDPIAMVRPVKTVVAKYDNQLAVTNVRTMDQIARESIAEPRFRARLLGAFATLAMLLSAIGVFGVLTFSVAQRTLEFGVRMALGGQISDVMRLVLGRSARIALVGIAMGSLGTAVLARSLSALLFGVRPLDPVAFVSAPVLLALVAFAASGIPAMRAARTDPAVALRQE